MSERNDITTTGGDGHGPADPLARIGTRLIEAAQVQRRRRAHARQRLAGGALTLLLIVAAIVVAQPFEGDAPPATTDRATLVGRDGRFSVWANERGTLCATRPGVRDPGGITTCASAKQLSAALGRWDVLWPQARMERGRVVLSGIAAADLAAISVTPSLSAFELLPDRLPANGVTTTQPTFAPHRFELDGAVVTVPHGRGTIELRPFTVELPRERAGMLTVLGVPRSRELHSSQTIAIGQRFAPSLRDGRWMRFRTPAGVNAAQSAERVQARLDLMLKHGAQVTGEGRTLHVEVPRATRLDDVRTALAPGHVEVFDWERSALLPDDTTVADGLAQELPRATTISRAAGASTALTLTEARAQLRRQPGAARIVQARGPFERGEPLRRDDPRARFYVLRGEPALRSAAGVHVAPLTRAGGDVHPYLRFEQTKKPALRRLTRTIAQRGQDLMLPGVSAEAAAQHLAVVLDDRLVTLAAIDPARQPDGVTGDAVLLPDSVVRRGLRELTDVLASGPLPPLTEVR